MSDFERGRVPTLPLGDTQGNRYKYVIVSERMPDLDYRDPQTLFVTASDFISNKSIVDFRKMSGAKVINLCSSFDYLSKGYYCSMMAEARGLRCIPGVEDMVSLNWKRHYQIALPELNALVDKCFRPPHREPTSYKYIIYFGRIGEHSLEPLGRKLFDLFRFPMITVEIKQDGKGRWAVDSVEPLPLSDLAREKQETFTEALKKFTGSAWRGKSGRRARHWIAILHDPHEKSPPSDKAALNKFLKAGKDLNVEVEFLTKADYPSLIEYDALFIRETTAINHHTYRFAAKAERENIPCIDDASSIIRCCNKVFQYEMLQSNRIAVPETFVVDRKGEKAIAQDIEYPCVVKIPDGAFSRGMAKVRDAREFHVAASQLLKKSDVVIAQEFVESAFDWRVGVIDGQPLFACKYYMADGHWQIYNHHAKNPDDRLGLYETVRIEDVPADVMSTALKSANLIGRGLYGVDLKVAKDGRIIVMEVNDNPNIDGGIEDEILGDRLYQTIIASLVSRIEAGHGEASSGVERNGLPLTQLPYPRRGAGGRG